MREAGGRRPAEVIAGNDHEQDHWLDSTCTTVWTGKTNTRCYKHQLWQMLIGKMAQRRKIDADLFRMRKGRYSKLGSFRTGGRL